MVCRDGDLQESVLSQQQVVLLLVFIVHPDPS